MGSNSKRASIIGVACIIGLVLGVVAWNMASRVKNAPYTIEVAGKPLATVESGIMARKVLAEVRHQGPGGFSTRFAEDVTLVRAQGNAQLSEFPEAVRALESSVTVEADGFAIVVDNNPVVALPSKKAAEETLDQVKALYEHKVKSLYTSSSFKEKVFVAERSVRVGLLRSSPEDAASALTATSERPLVHMIQSGDRASDLAREYGVSMTQLEALNSGLDLENLTEGNLLTIRLPKLPITVVCKSLVTQTVEVTPPADMRYGPRSGTRVSKMLVTYENGQPAGQEVFSQVTTWDRPAASRYRHRRHRSTSVHAATGGNPAQQGSGQDSGKPPG